MSGIDWSKAPEGATHYLAESDTDHECWLKLEGNVWFYMRPMQSDWRIATIDEDSRKTMTPRPSSPAWSGPQDGLPPAGVECLACWTSKTREYHKARIVAHDGGEVIYRWLDGPDAGLVRADDGHDFEMGRVKAFLPIRTPEQIAADEREAAIEELRKLLSSVACDDYQAAVAMIDAGYRKQEQPK